MFTFVIGDSESRSVLDAFFLGKALAEALNERVESAVGELLSTIGRLQSEQQKQVLDFQVAMIISQVTSFSINSVNCFSSYYQLDSTLLTSCLRFHLRKKQSFPSEMAKKLHFFFCKTFPFLVLFRYSIFILFQMLKTDTLHSLMPLKKLQYRL